MEDTQKNATRILSILKKLHADAPVTYLNHRNPFEMLVATILSARTTDAFVNKITPELFKRYPTPAKLAKADLDDIRTLIHGVGAYNNKSVFLKDTAQMLVDKFSGEVPRNLEDLVKLKGVSRKTANVVLQVAFAINEGVVVDTHIGRVSKRLGLTKEEKPDKVEQDLMELFPQKEWANYARYAGAHGRRICPSRKPKCSECALNDVCPSSEL
ncbi:MAG: endonuclease III [Candidatus Thorarchaeota archaeon]